MERSGTLLYPRSRLPLRARMTNDAPRLTLLEELDTRQNELLDELDRLNARIEQVLAECNVWRESAGISPIPSAA